MDGSNTSSPQTLTDVAGNTSAPSDVVMVKIDMTAPVTTARPGPGTLPAGLPLISVNATTTVKDSTGTVVGSTPFTCFDTPGLTLALVAADANGSGVASFTYAATGAQTITSMTVNGGAAQPSITTAGLTKLSFAAVDSAGNKETAKSETIIVGRGFACAGPTPTFSFPSHGTLVVTGTATVNGKGFPIIQSIRF